MEHGARTLVATATTQEATNALLSRLPNDERRQLLSAATSVRLRRREVLEGVGDGGGVVLFPLTSVVSLQTMTEDGAMVELAMIGREGVIGFPRAHGIANSPYCMTAQIPGQALRVRADVLRRSFEQSPAVRQVILDYWHTLLDDIARGSACHCFHTAQQRLSCWLLTASDRARLQTLHMTHEDLSNVLGLPRPSVTQSALALREAGAIRYRQGRVTIVDRRRLSQAACECYCPDPSGR